MHGVAVLPLKNQDLGPRLQRGLAGDVLEATTATMKSNTFRMDGNLLKMTKA